MEMGMVGLGRMGGNMVTRLQRKGHRLIAFDRAEEAVARAEAGGAKGARTLQEFVAAFESSPRVMWVMVPAGTPTTETIATLGSLGQAGDIVIDGGNTNWKTALEDARALEAKGLRYLDAGTSGGIWGLENGYSLMVGGSDDAY